MCWNLDQSYLLKKSDGGKSVEKGGSGKRKMGKQRFKEFQVGQALPHLFEHNEYLAMM